MSEHDWQLGIGQVSVDDIQVGAAHAAGGDSHTKLSLYWFRIGAVDHDERRSDSLEHQCTHENYPKE
jgi:hypothetical protein